MNAAIVTGERNRRRPSGRHGKQIWQLQIDNCYIVNITITAEGSISSRTVSQQLDIYEIDGHCYLFFPDMMWNHPITGLL